MLREPRNLIRLGLMNSAGALGPLSLVAPRVTGGLWRGDTLTVTRGTWRGAVVAYAYQWYRDGVAIAGATERTYTTVQDDVGAIISIYVTATDTLGRSAVALGRSPMGPILVEGVAPPVPVILPEILVSGPAMEGELLEVTEGYWKGKPGLAYQWYRDGAAIAGATGTSYLLVNADVGAIITAIVTGTNTADAIQAVSSNQVGPILTARPVNTVAPAVSGTALEGELLSVSTGTWGNDPTGFTYQWQRGVVAIAGATASTYALTAADEGALISAIVTASNVFGPQTASSNQAGPIGSTDPVNTVAPVATGTAAIEGTLSVTTGTWTNSPTGYAYQWYRGGVAIAGATASTYTLVGADGGAMVSCQVTASNAFGSASAFSNALGPVSLVAVDPYWENVILLAGFDSGAFVDESRYNHAVTQGTAGWVATGDPKFGTHRLFVDRIGSNYFANAHSDFTFPAGTDFTIESWFKFTQTAITWQSILSCWTSAVAGSYGFHMVHSSNNYLNFAVQGFNWISTTTKPTLNVWSHIAVVRTGDVGILFLNGVEIGRTTGWGAIQIGNGAALYIGANAAEAGGGDEPYTGYFDEARVTKGVARYTANFTPPDAKFPRGAILAPINTAAPVISGTPTVGQTLTSTTGTWSGIPTGYAYQWRADGVAISGATSSSYVLVSGDVGDTITCQVTASNAGGSTAAVSNALGPVADQPTTLSMSEVFTAGRKGGWYAPYDLTKVYQTHTLTTPVTADGQFIGRIEDGSGTSNEVIAETGGALPTYQAEAGKYWVEYDGTNDVLYNYDGEFTGANRIVGSIAWRKGDDTENGHVFALTGNSGQAPLIRIDTAPLSDGTTRVTVFNGTNQYLYFPAAVNEDMVITFDWDVPGNKLTVRKNGTLVSTNTASAGSSTAAWGDPVNIFLGRNGISEFFGRVYGAAFAAATGDADAIVLMDAFDAELIPKLP